MPSNTRYISQPSLDFGESLKISGFSLTNEVSGSPHLEPFPYDAALAPFSGEGGIPLASLAASGQFFSDSPAVEWSLIDPRTNTPFDTLSLSRLNFFRGFDVSILDETGMLVERIATGYYATKIVFETDTIKTLFEMAGGDADLRSGHGVGQDPRRFRFEVVSHTKYGNQKTDLPYTGSYFLTSPQIDITGLNINQGELLVLDPFYSQTTGLQTVHVYASHISGFNVDSTGSGTALYDFSMGIENEEGGRGVARFPSIEVAPPVIESGLFYKVIAEDNYGTGSGFLFPSSIKPQTLNPLSYSQVVSGVSGIVVASKDSFNGARAQALLKWNRENTPSYVDYEVKVTASGEVLNKIDTVFTKTPFVDGVVRFIQGTGTGRIDKKFFNVE